MSDLGDRLARVAGPAGAVPDLDDLWWRGRRRRLRRRAVAGLGAATMVAALVASGALVAGGGDEEGVIAGPGLGTPPPEPIDVPVRMVVEAGPPLEGVPTLVPGEMVMVSYLGYDDDQMRGVSVDWEAWDGSSWEQTHTLILGLEPDGSDGEVVPVGEDLLIRAAGMSGSGPDPFRAPSDLGPGWYRVCVDVGGGDNDAVSSEEDDGSTPESVMATGPPGDPMGEGDRDPQAGDEARSRRVRPCAQLRVLSPAARADPRADDGPATEVSVTARLSMSPAAAGAVHPGAFFMVTTEATAGGWHVATMASWERWDGDRWRRTHVLDGVGADTGAGDEPSARSDPDASVRWAATSESPAVPHETRFIAPRPDDARPGRYRVCLRAVRSWGQLHEERTEVCVPVLVEGEPSSDDGSTVPPSTGTTAPG